MKDHAAAVVSDEAFAKRAERWPVSTPDTKEAYWIREIFDGESPYPLYSLAPVAGHLSSLVHCAAGLYPLEAAAKTAVRYV